MLRDLEVQLKLKPTENLLFHFSIIQISGTVLLD